MSAALMAVAAKKQQSGGAPRAPKPQYGGRKGEVPALAKNVLIIVAVAGAAYGIYKLSKHISQGREGRTGNKDEDKSLNKEYYDLQKNPSTRATLTKGEMAQIANNIFAAVNGTGTDEQAIIRNLKKVKTDGDFVGIQNAYGIRTTESFWYGDFKGTLTATLGDELSDYWIKQINQGLKMRGIDRRV